MSQTGEDGGDFDWDGVVNWDDLDDNVLNGDVPYDPNAVNQRIKRPKVDRPKVDVPTDPYEIYSALEVLENSDPPFFEFGSIEQERYRQLCNLRSRYLDSHLPDENTQMFEMQREKLITKRRAYIEKLSNDIKTLDPVQKQIMQAKLKKYRKQLNDQEHGQERQRKVA